MFRAIASSPQPIRLHRLRGAILASTGFHVARAQGGQLHEMRKLELPGAPDAQPQQPQLKPSVRPQITSMVGRWPDQVWALVYAGPGMRAIEGPMPGATLWIQVSRNVVVRWDDASGCWVEHPENEWVGGWGDGVLVTGSDGRFRWADGADTPIDPVLSQGIFEYCPYVTRAGEVILRVIQSPRYEPGWWIFRRGERQPERFEWPPGVDEQSAAIFIDYRSNGLFASGMLTSGEKFIAHRVQGEWKLLPPFRESHEVRGMLTTSSGQVFLCARAYSMPVRIYRLTAGGDWESVSVPFHTKCSGASLFELDAARVGGCPPYQLVAGENDELWLAADFAIDDVHRAVLYHASV
ncbi:hypothetical protein WME97_39540 [Sorangium sp. So ce367]|uniref:hypothetical protein n=1 Tax=Sorangium sp. So ce367 TaxID=3133305 RepID=UPI003F61322A